MDWYLWLTLSAVLIAVPGTAVSILQLMEWRQKHVPPRRTLAHLELLPVGVWWDVPLEPTGSGNSPA